MDDTLLHPEAAPSSGLAREAPEPSAPMSEPPPPLGAIRVRPPGARGLNKPAIILAAGGAIFAVLLVAVGALSSGNERRPSEGRPLMSDPARPEMARGAVRDLPARYDAAGLQTFASPSATRAPILGPPLPGDIAAFAPEATRAEADRLSPEPARDVHPATDERAGWREAPGDAGGAIPAPASPEAEEADLARRSPLFFVRPTTQAPSPDVTRASQAPASPLLALAPARDQDDTPGRRVTQATLHPGAVIAASLLTAIDSEAPGPVIAQVTQSVHDSLTGRTLLIPQGARLIGDYTSAARYGQSRIAITWSRLILPDGREIALDEPALDPSGAAGLRGRVDNHWGELFGAAALGTLVSVGAAATRDPPRMGVTYDGVGVFGHDDPVADALRDGLQRSAGLVANRTVERGLATPPTIRIDAGAKVSVIVTRPLSI